MTTAYRRARHKINHARAGGHTWADHVPGQRCTVCRPLPRTPEQKAAALWQAEQRRIELADHAGGSMTTLAKRALLSMGVFRSKNAQVQGTQVSRMRRTGKRGT